MNRNRNKIIGSLIGGAIGDALGYPIEFKRGIKEKEYTKYLNDKGIISDDTQMTLFTANALLWRETRGAMRGIAPLPVDAIYYAYLDWLETQNSDKKNRFKVAWIKDLPELNINRAPGNTCLSALMSKVKGTLEQPINNSKGCGGVMRVAPIGLYISDSKNAGKFSAEASAITHGHPLGIIPSYFLGTMIYYIVNENLNIFDSLNKAYNQYIKEYNIFDKKEVKYFIDLINKAIKLSKSDCPDIDAINELGEGWVAEEAFVIALYSCLKYENSFEDAIICAVNHDGDSDSTGAIAGNIMGALLGLESIPKYYIDNLELKDVIIEIGSDLSVDVPVGEYNDNNDEYWLNKYMYCKRNLELKKNDEVSHMNNNLKNEMIDYIKNMPDGESDSIKNIYDKVCKNKSEETDLFKLQEEIEKECENNGIVLDYSKYENLIVGLPYDVNFVKRNNQTLSDKTISSFEKPIKENDCNVEEYVYDFIPYEKIGPIFLNKTDESLYESGGVKYLQENAFNHVLCRPSFLDHPQTIKRGLNNKKLIITIDKENIKINCYYNAVLDNLKKVADDFVEFDDSLDNGNLTKTAYSRKLGVIIFAIMDNNEYYIYSIRFLGKEQFEKLIQKEKSSSESSARKENMEEFKINNNISFEDEETKIEYQKYLDEINEYNRKIANGETPEKDLSEIADEYKSKFKVNNKINSTYNTNNTINDKDKFDELLKKFNDNLKTSETSNLDEQIGQINNRISELEQQEKVEEIIISDLDLGNITINTTNGKINCDNMKYSDKRLYNDFPIEYSMNEIEIYDLKSCNFEECKNLFVDNLHFISDMKDDIEEKIIQEIWNWFSADFTPEALRQQFLKLCIKVMICLYDGNYINLRTSWVFEEENSDINSGYADFNVDINSKSIERTDIGFY